MNYLREDSSTRNERLARAFYTNARYSPHFLGVTGIGFFTIYVLSSLGIFGQPAPQLIYIGFITSLLAAISLEFDHSWHLYDSAHLFLAGNCPYFDPYCLYYTNHSVERRSSSP
jgi:hypothetical protein